MVELESALALARDENARQTQQLRQYMAGRKMDEPKPPPPHTVKFSVALTDMDIGEFDVEKEAAFRDGVAAKLGVEPSKVDITASAGR